VTNARSDSSGASRNISHYSTIRMLVLVVLQALMVPPVP